MHFGEFCTMICFPISKINLGLQVLSRRTDGYHNIESVFYPCHYKDILEIVPLSSEAKTEATYRFQSSGFQIPGNVADNLVIKAWEYLQRQFKLPAVNIHLHKAIPMGAGMGGGSSDGASAISLISKFFRLGLNQLEMEETAAHLGSDCPFFIEGKPKLVRGRGEILEPIELNLNSYRFELEFPGIHISTAEAYAGIKCNSDRPSIQDLISYPISQWKDVLFNDFEEIVFIKHPEIKIIKDNFYRKGAIYASLTGSGSAVYGIFEK